MFSTQPINQQESLKVIYQAYDVSSLARPKVVFCQSPVEAARIIAEKELNVELLVSLVFELYEKLSDSLCKERLNNVDYINSHSSLVFLYTTLNYDDFCLVAFDNLFEFDYIANYCSLCDLLFHEITLMDLREHDFLIEEFDLDCDRESWQALKYLAQECPYTFAFRDICLVVERPTELNFDRINHLHCEGKPAVRFIDGSEVYAFHRHEISKKYGNCSYSQWQSRWFLEDDKWRPKVELFRGIGYERFRQEMPESEYSFWQEYKDLIRESLCTIQLYFLFNSFKKSSSSNPSLNAEQWQELNQSLPFKITNEVREVDKYIGGNREVAPNLFIYPLEEAIKNYLQPDWLEKNSFAFPLFYGNDREVYYIVCYPEEKDYSEVWYVKENSQPKICGINVTSLMLSIAECYETGAYYLARNEEKGGSFLEQDRSKVETIFRKFNPDYIEVWQEIWNEI